MSVSELLASTVRMRTPQARRYVERWLWLTMCERYGIDVAEESVKRYREQFGDTDND